MKANPFLSELALLAQVSPAREASTLRERQRQMRRLHVTAFRRAMRRLREIQGPVPGGPLA